MQKFGELDLDYFVFLGDTMYEQASEGSPAAVQGKGPFTVFVLTDAAFAKVPKATLTKLQNDPMLLKSVLLYHVVKGKVPASTVVTLNDKSARRSTAPPSRSPSRVARCISMAPPRLRRPT